MFIIIRTTTVFCTFLLFFPLEIFPQTHFSSEIFSSKKVKVGFYQPEQILTYNPVDGIKIRPGGKISWQFKNLTYWENSLALGYSFNQDKFIWNFNTKYEYLPEKRAGISFSFGKESYDFNVTTGVNPLGNTLGCLLLKNSSVNFYDRFFFAAEHHVEIFNGFNTKITFNWESRKELFNSSDFAIFFHHSRNYDANTPSNGYVAMHPDAVEDGTGAGFAIEISYTPFQYYTYSGRKKINTFSSYPSFHLMWRKGISHLFNSNSDYDHLQLSISQKIGLDPYRGFSYHLSAGWFLNNKKMHFSDYKHSRVYIYPLTLTELYQTFHTMDIYYPSTNEWYIESFLKYDFLHLIIKHIPGLNRTIMTESLYLSYFTNPLVKHYIEIGYSLNSILRFFNVGIFAGFEEWKYTNFIFKIAINIDIKN